MKILIVSDTHGKTDRLYDLLCRKRKSVGLVIHLGDYADDALSLRSEFPETAFLTVAGNCDRFADSCAPAFHVFSLEGHRLFLTHGHRYGVGTSLDALAYTASTQKADIALFGHTHVRTHLVQNGIHLYNPGSLELPRDDSDGSFGLLTLTPDTILFSTEEYRP